VFEPGYKLESIDEHSEFMWQEKHLPAMQKMQKDENGQEIVEIGARSKGIVEELEKAHIYIEQLNKEIVALKSEKDSLSKDNEDIKARLSAMESQMAKLSLQ
jgi:predicted  nucleic acid-binding Zn-ribbon protein